MIIRDPNNPDDFAQATNIGVMALCQLTDKWPNLADYENMFISEEVLAAVNPAEIHDWDDVR